MAVDLTFRINWQAEAVLHLLRNDPAFEKFRRTSRLEVTTWPFYNGREHGVCVAVKEDAAARRPTLLISFGENRNTDDMFVQHEVVRTISMNGPSIADFSHDAYADRVLYGEGEHHDVACHIVRLAEKHAGVRLLAEA